MEHNHTLQRIENKPQTFLSRSMPQPLSPWHDRLELAELMAKSGVFPTITSAARALVAIEIGSCLGMQPAQALMNIEFGAQGKPTISVHWQAAQLRLMGYTWTFLKHDTTICSIQFLHKEVPVDEPQTFTLQEAKAITIYDKQQNEKGGRATLGDKWNWKSWSKDMLYAYVMRRFVKWHEPQILGGMSLSADEDSTEYALIGGTEPIGEEKPLQAHIADVFGDPIAWDQESSLLDRIVPDEAPKTLWKQILRANLSFVPLGPLRVECLQALKDENFNETRGNMLADIASGMADSSHDGEGE